MAKKEHWGKPEPQKERLMRASEWAREDKIDSALFVWWDNKQITKSEYETIKLSVYNARKKRY